MKANGHGSSRSAGKKLKYFFVRNSDTEPPEIFFDQDQETFRLFQNNLEIPNFFYQNVKFSKGF